MAKRVFIVHGWEGSPDGGWLPWLKRELETKGFSVYALAMPNANHPKVGEWIDYLAKSVGELDKDCYFVGYSLGCIIILRYLETLREDQKIGGILLVAGFSSDLEPKYAELKQFTSKPVNWTKVKSHCERFVIVHSQGDYVVPVRHAHILKEKLGAELIIKQNMKHFSGDDGVMELPIALEVILKISE
jgi:uncharacterized protein